MGTLSRRKVVQRATAGAVGLFSLAFAEQAQGYHYATDYTCHGVQTAYPHCESGSTPTCKVRIGPPTCTIDNVYVDSPNYSYHQRCWIECYTCGGCAPTYAQPRGATNNDGNYCSCTVV